MKSPVPSRDEATAFLVDHIPSLAESREASASSVWLAGRLEDPQRRTRCSALPAGPPLLTSSRSTI